MRELDTGTPQLLARVDNGVGWLELNNPERRNAITTAMQRAVPAVLVAFSDDPRVHVVVLTGAGDRAFASGADAAEFEQTRSTDAGRVEYDVVLAAFWSAWASFDKPTIAMIRGYCIGGGLLLALQADIRVAAIGSEFAVAAAGVGAGLASWGVEAVLAVVGPARAAEMLFSARRLSAQEAFAIGLVNRVVPGHELEQVTRDLAATIAANATAA